MNRWLRLGAAVVAMIMIANLQYSWTLFVKPIIAATGWKLSEVQWGFTFFIAVETWGMPLSGWLIDRVGPRFFMTFGGLLCGAGWAVSGTRADAPATLFGLCPGRVGRRARLLRIGIGGAEVVPR